MNNTDHNTTDNITDNTTDNITDNTTDNITDNVTDNTTDNITDNAAHNATDNITDNAAHNATDNAAHNATHFSDINLLINHIIYHSLHSQHFNHSIFNNPFDSHSFALLQAFASYFANLLLSSKLFTTSHILRFIHLSFSSYSLLLFHSYSHLFLSNFFLLAFQGTCGSLGRTLPFSEKSKYKREITIV
jgi:hypothetical protein